jgi:hypothetical protein
MRWFVLLFNGRRLFSDKVNKGGMGLPSIDAILSTRRYHLAYLSTRQRFNPGLYLSFLMTRCWSLLW